MGPRGVRSNNMQEWGDAAPYDHSGDNTEGRRRTVQSETWYVGKKNKA